MAVMIGLKAIVGVGLFTAPSALQITTGPAGIITYGIVSIAALFMALAMARVAQLYPEKGAFYSYAKAWGGHTMGLLAIMSYMIGLIVALGLLAIIAGSYMHAYFIGINSTLLGIAAIGLTILAHLAGTEIAKAGQKILIILTYIPIVLITLLCLIKANIHNLQPFFPHGWTSIFTAVPIVIFGFFGFEAIPSLFENIKHPQRNVPRAMILTMILTGCTYIIFTSSIFIGLPRELFTSDKTPLSAALLHLYPHFTWLVTCIDWAIIITITGVLHAMMWSLSALTVDTSKHIFGRAELSKKNALLIIGALTTASCYLFQNTMNLMFALVALSIVFAYASAIAVLLFQQKGRSAYQIIIAILGLSTAALIFGCALIEVVTAY